MDFNFLRRSALRLPSCPPPTYPTLLRSRARKDQVQTREFLHASIPPINEAEHRDKDAEGEREGGAAKQKEEHSFTFVPQKKIRDLHFHIFVKKKHAFVWEEGRRKFTFPFIDFSLPLFFTTS